MASSNAITEAQGLYYIYMHKERINKLRQWSTADDSCNLKCISDLQKKELEALIKRFKSMAKVSSGIIVFPVITRIPLR